MSKSLISPIFLLLSVCLVAGNVALADPRPDIPDRLEVEEVIRAYRERTYAYDADLSAYLPPNQAGAIPPMYPPNGFYTGSGTGAQIETKIKDILKTVVTETQKTTSSSPFANYVENKQSDRLTKFSATMSDVKINRRWAQADSTTIQSLSTAELFTVAQKRLRDSDAVATRNGSRTIQFGDGYVASNPNREVAVELALDQALENLATAPYTGSSLAWYSVQYRSGAPYEARARVCRMDVTLTSSALGKGIRGSVEPFARLGGSGNYATPSGVAHPIPLGGDYHPIPDPVKILYEGNLTNNTFQGSYAGATSDFKNILVFDPMYEGDDDDKCSEDDASAPTAKSGVGCKQACGDGGLNSLHFTFNLGDTRFGKESGALKLFQFRPGPEWFSPRSLTAEGRFGFNFVRNATRTLLQATGPGVLVNAVVLDSASYELRYFHWDGSGTPDSAGVYPTPAGSPHTVFLVENLDEDELTFNSMKITRTAGSQIDYWTFHYDETSKVWTYTSDNGKTIQEFENITTTDPDVRIEQRITKDDDGVILSKKRETYERFPWGEELVEVVTDPDGAALTRTMEFYDDPVNDGSNYRFQKSSVDENGFWKTFSYDFIGRLQFVKEQHEDAAFDAAPGLCRVTEYVYPTSAGGSVDYYTTIVTLLGQEISRKYRRVTLEGYDEFTCTVPGAGITATTNLVREVRNHIGNAYAGWLKSVRDHDGTLTTYQYAALNDLSNVDIENGTELTTVIEKGEPNGAGTSVVDGIRTTTVQDRRGNVIAETVVDIDSGLTIEQRLVTQQDAFGRATVVQLLDGREETFVYDCCGLVSQTDSLGISTAFDETDGIERSVTRLGVTTTTRRDGRTTERERHDGDTLIALGSVTRDIAGRTVEIVGRGGRTTSIARTVNGAGNRVVTHTLPNNATRVEELFPDGSVVQVTGTGVNGQAFDYGIESGQYVVKTTELDETGTPTSEWTKSFHDTAGRVWKIVHANGATWLTSFNDAGQMVRTADPDGVATLYSYDGQGRLETFAIDLNGNDVIDLDGIDRVTRVTMSVAPGLGAYPVVRTVSEIWRSTGSDTPTEVMRIDAEVTGNAAWMTTPAGSSHRSLSRGAPGAWTITTNIPDGSRVVENYAGGRLFSRVLSDGGSVILEGTSFGYDGHGRLETSTDFRNGTTTRLYHNTDELASVTTPPPGDGRPAQTTSYTYTALGLVDTVTMPDAGVVDYGYTAKGLLETVSGARVYPQLYTYTAQGRPSTLVTNPGTAHAQTTSWFYHPLSGLTSSKTFPGGNSLSFTYTDAGRLATRTNGRAVVATYFYDDAGENSGVDYSDSTTDVAYTFYRDGAHETVTHGAEVRTFGYGSPGVLTSETTAGGVLDGLALTIGRDALDRRTSFTFAFAGESVTHSRGYQSSTSRLGSVSEGDLSASYQYHPASNLLKSATHRENTAVRLVEARSYDALGMLSSIASLGTGSATPVQRSYGYTRNGINQVTGVTREDDFDWVYGYDAKGHLETASRKLPNGTSLAGEQFGYTYDPLGNRLEATFGGGTGGTHSVAYTPAGGDVSQVDEIETPGVALVTGQASSTATVLVDGVSPSDRQGERFAHPVSVDNSTDPVLAVIPVTAEEGGQIDSATVKKLVPKASIFYDYDADGNVLSDGFFSYTWDAENRLLSVETVSGAAPVGVAEVKVDFAYDYAGRRILRQAYRRVSGSWSLEEDQRFVHDGANVAGEWNGAGDLQRTFLWGADLSSYPSGAGGAGGLVSIADHSLTAPSAHFASYDGGGNLVGLTNAADGEASALYDYDSYGNLLSSSGPMSEENPFRFGTQWRDAATGHDLYHFRVYDPVHGRWLSRDPIGEAGGINLYGFLGNSPIGDADIFGAMSFGDLYQGIRNADYRSGTSEGISNVVNATQAVVRPIWEGGVAWVKDPQEQARLFGLGVEATNASWHEIYDAFGDPLFWDDIIDGYVDDFKELPEAIQNISSDPSLASEFLADTSIEILISALGLKGGKLGGKGCDVSKPRRGAPGCFIAGTIVISESGEKPIEKINVGEKVWSYNQRESKWELREVKNTYSLDYDGDFVTLFTGSEVIKATGNHPIWVVEGEGLILRPRVESDLAPHEHGLTEGGRWVEARHLRVGDRLRRILGGTGELKAIVSTNEKLRVFNIHVEGNNNYAVSEYGFLVHNSSMARNPLQDVKVKEKRGNLVARELGYKDAHDLKKAFNADSRQNIYKGSDGNYYLKTNPDDIGEWIQPIN